MKDPADDEGCQVIMVAQQIMRARGGDTISREDVYAAQDATGKTLPITQKKKKV